MTRCTVLNVLAPIKSTKVEYRNRNVAEAGVQMPVASSTFKEFWAKFPEGFEKTYERLLSKRFVAGLPLGRFYPELEGHYLLCVTETLSKIDIEQPVKEVTA